MYATDRGIEEFEQRRADEEFTAIFLADRMRIFVDLHPEFENAIDKFATWLARDDNGEDDDP